jgi:hypothetical protein
MNSYHSANVMRGMLRVTKTDAIPSLPLIWSYEAQRHAAVFYETRSVELEMMPCTLVVGARWGPVLSSQQSRKAGELEHVCWIAIFHHVFLRPCDR